MTVLGIETSCDETAAAIVVRDDTTKQLNLLSNIVASSLSLHAKTGGIIPEIAAREQVKYIIPVINEALERGINYNIYSAEKNSVPPLDAIAVTFGPGLIGSLLVGVETAKTLALIWNKPIIPVNHLYGHIYANLLSTTAENKSKKINFPAIALVVSGGHTDLVLMESYQTKKVIGGTRDDAAGEAFDKIGRLLNLPYPAGAMISQLATLGNPQAFNFPRPMINSSDFDFSFSGLKTAVLNLIKKENFNFQDEKFAQENKQLLYDICASAEEAIIEVLVKKTVRAIDHYNAKSLLVGGGVAANEKLKLKLQTILKNRKKTITLSIPPKSLCTDNAAMIAAASYFTSPVPLEQINVNPGLYF